MLILNSPSNPTGWVISENEQRALWDLATKHDFVILADEVYDRIRINLFWMHYQFIMANDRRAPYDYCMLLCGPVPAASWAEDPQGVLAAFAPDARLAEDRVALPAAGGPSLRSI